MNWPAEDVCQGGKWTNINFLFDVTIELTFNVSATISCILQELNSGSQFFFCSPDGRASRIQAPRKATNGWSELTLTVALKENVHSFILLTWWSFTNKWTVSENFRISIKPHELPQLMFYLSETVYSCLRHTGIMSANRQVGSSTYSRVHWVNTCVSQSYNNIPD